MDAGRWEGVLSLQSAEEAAVKRYRQLPLFLQLYLGDPLLMESRVVAEAFQTI